MILELTRFSSVQFQPPPPQNQIPLVVDLDGTLIKTDLLWESLARLLRRNPLRIFHVLFWWARGRAFLKKQLASRVRIDPATQHPISGVTLYHLI